MNPPEEPEYVEVWSDLVSLKDLLIALGICAATTAGALAISTFTSQSNFFWGLGGAVLGFVISVFVIKPKRDVEIIEDKPLEEQTEASEVNH